MNHCGISEKYVLTGCWTTWGAEVQSDAVRKEVVVIGRSGVGGGLANVPV
jgi:hypothetical protein